MSAAVSRRAERLHARQDRAWRDPSTVVAQWADAASVDPRLLRHRERGAFWATLASTRMTLVVTREYEHLVMALHAGAGGPRVSYLPLPHPSGVAVDRRRGVIHVASTRNPNQVMTLAPARAAIDVEGRRHPLPERPLVPTGVRVLPGRTYLHDLAFVGERLHANAVGQNAVVRVDAEGITPVWWPKAIDGRRGPALSRNVLQLNSIAAGPTLRQSYFSASTDVPGRHRPGDPAFPVDRRGVIFSGATREPVVRGLTRPHSARLRGRRLWVDNSGYGEVGPCVDGRFEPVARPGGWTRGLACVGRIAFVGTSRVLPRFRQYAPGLDPDRCVCGVHAIDLDSGRTLGSLVWPYGNQIFGVEVAPARLTQGFPLVAGDRMTAARSAALFYGFETAR